MAHMQVVHEKQSEKSPFGVLYFVDIHALQLNTNSRAKRGWYLKSHNTSLAPCSARFLHAPNLSTASAAAWQVAAKHQSCPSTTHHKATKKHQFEHCMVL